MVEVVSKNKRMSALSMKLTTRNVPVPKPTLKLLTLTLLAGSLIACSSVPKGPIATTADNIVKVRCTGWKQQTYDSVSDTPETVVQVRAHNLFGQNIGCWMGKKGKK